MVKPATIGKPEAFTIDIPERKLQHAAELIRLTDLTDFHSNTIGDIADDGNDFTYGLQPDRIDALVARLKSGFDWREWENKMNEQGEHYKVKVSDIDGVDYSLDIHYVVARSSNPDAVPILLIHGWPGSFFEFHKIVPILTKRYHVVMPSLVGYTFSSAPPRALKNTSPVTLTIQAIACDAAMRAAGFTDTYVAQGGDWGSQITRRVAQIFPDRCKAIHLNMVMNPPPEDVSAAETWEKTGATRAADFFERGQGYSALQSTVPHTLGAVLATSPVATVLYIGEKLYRWTSPDTKPTVDEILAAALLYFYSGSIASSFYLYFNRRVSINEDGKDIMQGKIEQPVAVGMGPYELRWPPRSTVEHILNLRTYRQLGGGGHFAAHEVPQLLAADMEEHFESEEVQKALGRK